MFEGDNPFTIEFSFQMYTDFIKIYYIEWSGLGSLEKTNETKIIGSVKEIELGRKMLNWSRKIWLVRNIECMRLIFVL